MKRKLIFLLFVGNAYVAYAAPPSELLIRSCLQNDSASPAVAFHRLDPHEIIEQDDYMSGFNAPYIFEYKGRDAGYAESKSDQALIFNGKLYRLSSAIPVGDNRGSTPGSFTPYLAEWGVAREKSQEYFCVSFNFDGLGQSGNFQKVHGGYLLDLQTKHLYYAVRYIDPDKR
jgi:hypothetical protein